MDGDHDGDVISPVHQFLLDRWKKRGTNKCFPSGFIVEEITRVADQKNDARRIPVFENWLLIFDEIVTWFSALALALKREFLTAEPASLHLSVMTVLATKFSADLFAIRILMTKGFEVQARILARSAVEAVELMFLVPHHPEMEQAFYDANDFGKTNDFWHRYVSKGRLRNRANKLTENTLRMEPDTWKKFRREHEEVHSGLAHPSTVMGLLAMFPDEEAEDRPGHWGVRSTASVMTMRYLCILCSNVILLNDFIPFRVAENYPALLTFNPDDVNHEAVHVGREVIQDATQFALEKINTVLFEVPNPDSLVE
jgi:hypothetical protein